MTLASISRAEQQALVERIAGSRVLQRAARLRELLLYIAENADHPEELAEQRIGVRIFGRSAAYNPAEDNIVRASARQLRVKLKEYFETEGLHEPVVLDIPKGAYLPVFTERPILPAPVPAADTKPATPWLRIGVFAVLLAAAAALLLDDLRLRSVTAEPESLMAQFLRQSPGSVRFVLTDSTLAIHNGLTGKITDVEAYSERTFLQDGEYPEMTRVQRDLAPRQITSYADVTVLARLLQVHPSSARRVEVRHARHMRTRDFKEGNYVITGSPRSNPWPLLFEDRLNFHFDGERLVNRSPQKGEAPEYRMDDNQQQWARVALIPNLSNNGWVLLAAGLRFESTEGAGEYLLQPESLMEVRRLLHLGGRDPLPPFELLLETKATEGTSRSSRIVAWRRHSLR